MRPPLIADEDDGNLEDAHAILITPHSLLLPLALDDIRPFMVPVSPLPHSLLHRHLQCFYLFSSAQVKKALQDADLSIEDVDEVVLVGGSSRIPIVQRL
jgi:hypothetical protein